MISKDEIKKLASLARIEIHEDELDDLRGEMEAILDYVKLVSQFHSGPKASGLVPKGVINIMREDADPTESGTFSKELINEFPNKEGNYLKVKKIL